MKKIIILLITFSYFNLKTSKQNSKGEWG